MGGVVNSAAPRVKGSGNRRKGKTAPCEMIHMLEKGGREDMMAEDRVLKPTDRVFDLVDVLDGSDGKTSQKKGEREVIVIDGRGYSRTLRPEDKIYNLCDVLEEGPGSLMREGVRDEEMKKIVQEMTEKIVRELFPDIAERIIKEEIEKLKGEQEGGY